MRLARPEANKYTMASSVLTSVSKGLKEIGFRVLEFRV